MIGSFHNISEGHGIGIMATGMLIVFFGLALLSSFIILLARFSQRKSPAQSKVAAAAAAETQELSEDEIMAITALVIYMESERTTGEWTHPIIPRKSRRGSIWASAGKMRSLSEGGRYA